MLQFLADILTIGIVQPPQPPKIGRTPLDKISETQLPFAQVFAPVVDLTEEAAQQPGTMTFVIEILDRREIAGQANRKDRMRQRLEALDTTLLIDSSFQGLIRKGFVAARAVAEVGDDKRVLGSATIICEFYDTQDDFLIGVSVGQTSFTNIVSFADSTKWTPLVCQIEDSKIIKGMLGLRRDAASTTQMSIEANSNNGGIASTISLVGVKRLRLRTYLTPEYGTGMVTSPYLELYTETNLSSGQAHRPAVHDFQSGIGWREWIYDVTSPEAVFGSGLTLGSVRVVRIVWTMFFAGAFSSFDFGLIHDSIGYHLRDLDSVTHELDGYHADTVR